MFSLLGSFCLSFLGIILPALMDICIKYPDHFGRFNISLVKDIFLILLGMVGGTLGTIESIDKYTNSSNSINPDVQEPIL